MKPSMQKPVNDLLHVTLGFQLVVLLVWEAGARSGRYPDYLVGPLEIVVEAGRYLANGEVFAHMGHSLFRVYVGFLVGSGLGVVLGLLSGVLRPVRDLLDTLQAFVHAVPKISLFPAVAVWLGFSDASRILIIALSCFFPAYLNAMSGALGINPKYLWLSRNNEMGRVRTFFEVILPASLPRTLVGLRISLMVAFILMVATEVVGHSDGLGSLVMLAYQNGAYPQMYAYILFIAIAGYLSNLLLQRLALWLCKGQAAEMGGRA
ncbi:ABC transporter permease [Hydrogenophaga sp. BPS33]|uniref:ABC transporter permease n=1 Tax=Hydrogenophaga sp. BPS33 TaxID=2651974 RepID=UPI001320433E|nr:ABC transporter permease [Hydrogenophaga sp. BPS33]QHE84929.1 ABC transporter permease [Hydrogenophaga sp. BPS33]